MKQIRNKFTRVIGFAMILSAFVTVNVWAHNSKAVITTQPNLAATAPAEQSRQQEAESVVPIVHATSPGLLSGPKICVAAPKTNLMPAETAPESLRNSLIKYLSGPAAEIVMLESLVAVQQQAEAAEKGCAFFLTMSVMQKKKGGGEGFGTFLKNTAGAAPLLNDLGASETAQTVSAVATKSQAKLTTAGDLAVTIKAKDEVTLEYNLFNTQTLASGMNGKLKTKAGKDGEDVLSGLLEQAVNAVLTAALRK